MHYLPFCTDEPRTSSSAVPPESVALFTIQRDAGAFTAVTVSWAVTTVGSGTDINPATGVVDFGEGQQSGSFEIRALLDEVCRAARIHYILYYMKGREPEWSIPKSSTGNCMNCTKMK